MLMIIVVPILDGVLDGGRECLINKIQENGMDLNRVVHIIVLTREIKEKIHVFKSGFSLCTFSN